MVKLLGFIRLKENEQRGTNRAFTPLETIERHKRNTMSLTGFTLIELLIVISIIAILAATIIPNFVGFDAEAKISATRTNLDSLRTRITLFRAKEGRYPDSLGDFLKSYYYDAGIKKAYLSKIPLEMISSKSGNNSYIDSTTDRGFTNQGGWIYFKDAAEIKVNLDESLPARWGGYAGQKPSEW